MEKAEEMSLEKFLCAYSAASAENKHAALRAAWATLNGVNGSAQVLLTQRALAKELALHETTVWRWQFPFVEWAGQKRYEFKTCKAYMQSPELKLRLEALRKKRRRKSEIVNKTAPAC